MNSSKQSSLYGINWEFENLEMSKFNIQEIKEKNIFNHKNKATHQLFEGDNLYSLTHLEKNYNTKIDIIYIDPPYNTGYKYGQEGFVYDDFFTNSKFQYKHSAWLNFLYHRLKIAKNLLSEKGIIFISIDENELAHLKLLCDKIFEEENFIQYFVWKKRTTGGKMKLNSVVSQTEYILAYAKNKTKIKFNKIQNKNKQTENWRDFRKSGGQWQKSSRPKQHYPFYYDKVADSLSLEKDTQHTIEILPQNAKMENGFWINGIETAKKRLKNNELKAVYIRHAKRYKILQLIKTKALQNTGNFIDIPSIKGTNELNFFDLSFNNTKPIALIQYILAIAAHPESIILDFFAGSGSTAQAVMEWNEKHNLNLTCILCESNEYHICEDITYKRMERVLNGYENKYGKKYFALNQNLKYFKIISQL